MHAASSSCSVEWPLSLSVETDGDALVGVIQVVPVPLERCVICRPNIAATHSCLANGWE